MTDKLDCRFAGPGGVMDVYARAGESDKLVVKEILFDNVYHWKPETMPENAVVIDLGANIGIFSLLAAQCKNVCRILAFEPEEENHWLLMQNIARNNAAKIITPIQQAVGGKTEKRLLMADRGRSTLKEHAQGEYHGEQKIDCVTLEDAMNKNGVGTCDFLKLDVEGSEYEIIEAAPKTIMERLKFIAIETHNTTPEQFGMMLAKLTGTHKLTTLGCWTGGGYIYCERY